MSVLLSQDMMAHNELVREKITDSGELLFQSSFSLTTILAHEMRLKQRLVPPRVLWLSGEKWGEKERNVRREGESFRCSDNGKQREKEGTARLAWKRHENPAALILANIPSLLYRYHERCR